MFHKLLSYLFPQFCIVCGVEGTIICSVCKAGIVIGGVYACPVCHKENKDGMCCVSCRSVCALEQHIAMVPYHNMEIFPKLIQQWKYEYNQEAGECIKQYVSNFLEDNQVFSIDIIVPVPLHRRRLAERGFNQAEQIARACAKKLCVPLLNILIRTRYTSQQAHLQREDRLKNLEDAFSVSSDIVGKRLLLVDDVFTTGTTLNECAQVLRQAGATSVVGFTVARG